MARIFCVVDVRYQPLAIILARQKRKEVFLYHPNLISQFVISKHYLSDYQPNLISQFVYHGVRPSDIGVMPT